MTRYRFELGLLVALAAIFAVVWRWQVPGRTLTAADVDRYVAAIDAGVDLPADEKADMLAHLRAWGAADDGRPVFMLNLMRYYDAPRPLRGLPASPTSARELNAAYERVAMPILFRLGAYPLFAGEPEGVPVSGSPGSNLLGYDDALEHWSRVLVVRYPDRRSFLELLATPEYQKVLPYKIAALKVVLVPMHDEVVVADLRWVAAAVLLAILVVVAVVRAARRAAA